MTSVFSSIFSNEEIQYLLQLPEVVAAKDRFGSSDKVQFTIALTDGIRTALQTRFGLDLSSVSEIPMRWIKGDTEAHVDRGSRSFENTYLVYLQDSEGEFVLGTDSYPITANTGFIFSEGTMHKTLNTGLTPRLLIGPMNEFAGPVGGGYATIIYYANLTDATNGDNALASGVQGATLQTVSPYSSWRVARVLDGATPQSVPSGVFASGYTITNWAGYAQRFTYHLYASQAVCFLEGTQILCLKDDVETYMPIETMRAGTLVKTRLDGYKKVELIGKNVIVNPGHSDRIEARLYKLSPSQYSELHDDLFITGAHAVLVETITDKQREELTKQAGKIFITDKKYRLMAMFDERAEPWASEGTYTIWHFALEHTNIVMNYGVYANGLLVETCSINTMRTKANLIIV